MTKASDNDFPSILVTEQGSAPSSPAASHQRLYVRTSDHTLVTVNSSGTVTPVGGGLSDPMTSRGDIIIRNSSNVTARLAKGTATYVLTSDGTDVAWAAPSGGGFTPAVGVVNLTSGNVTSSSSTFADITGLSITMTTGAHRVLIGLSASMEVTTNNSQYVMLDFTVDSTRQFTGNSGRAFRASNADAANHLDMTFLTAALSAGSHTFKVQWRNIDNATQMLLRADGTNYAAQFWAIEQAV